jgi:hypothetical protein
MITQMKLNLGLPWQEQHSTRRRLLSPANCYIWNIAETWTLRKIDQKYLESFEGWCWRRIEKISWNDRGGKRKKCYEESRRRGISYML